MSVPSMVGEDVYNRLATIRLEDLFGGPDDWTRHVHCLESHIQQKLADVDAYIRYGIREVSRLIIGRSQKFGEIEAGTAKIRRAQYCQRGYRCWQVRLMVTCVRGVDPGEVVGFHVSAPSLGSMLLVDLLSMMDRSEAEYRRAIRTLAAEAASLSEPAPLLGTIRLDAIRRLLDAIRRLLFESAASPAGINGPEPPTRRVLAPGGQTAAFVPLT